MLLSAENNHLLQKRLRAVLRPGEIILCAVVSTIVFAVVYWSCCFSIRYTDVAFSTLGTVGPLLASVGAMVVAMSRYRSQRTSRSWFALAVVMPTCFTVGYSLGNQYWHKHMVQYHTWRDMASYVNIDPDHDKGQSYMDAGTVYFKEGSYVSRNNTVAFHNGLTYCVAPIVREPIDREAGSEVLQTASGFVLPRSGTVDFWAAGTDCCSTRGAFTCGNAGSHMARSGMRVLDETSRSMFLLGVQDWSATTGLPVRHPLFFTWVQDPIVRAEDLKANRDLDFLTQVTKCFFMSLIAAFTCHSMLQKMHIQ